MSVYHRFNKGDLLHSVVYANPKVLMASGSTGSVGFLGWRGNTGLSSSLSLYGGTRGRHDRPSGLTIVPLDELDTHSIDRVIYITGSYPSTGSVQFVTVRREPAASVLTQVTSVDWYEEHFSPIEGLFDYYSQFNDSYFTGSYDFYTVHFKQNTAYRASAVLFSGTTLNSLTGTYTMEARIKPLSVTSSLQDFVIMSQRGRWKLFITGSNNPSGGQLCFYDGNAFATTSAAIQKGVWTHVAVAVSASACNIYINGVANPFTLFTSSLPPLVGALVTTSSFLAVGAEFVMSGTNMTPQADQGFHGFIYETRVWDVTRTATQVSASAAQTLSPQATGSVNLLHYARFNDGPLSTRHGLTAGSGAFEYGRAASHGRFQNMGTVLPLSPIWHTNDDRSFTTYKTKLTDTIDYFKVVHVPSLFYGRQIATGSVELVCNAYSRQGIVRVLKDDGRGGLYISGSITRRDGGEDYRGVEWNKVGNVFYSEGLIVITDPALLDFADKNKDWSGTTDLLKVSFDGVTRTPTKTFMCRIAPGDCNSSNNPTFQVFDDRGTVETDDDRLIPVRDDGTTYVTAIGIYNEERKLVAVAKLAQPIRNREKDKNTIRLRIDF